MNTNLTKKINLRKQLNDYLLIVIGCTIVSIGFVFFINPYKFVPGGVYGTSIVLHHLFPQLQVGTFGYFIGIPLLMISYFVLGKGLGAKTLFATLITPAIMNVLSTLVYPTEEALRELSPEQLCNGMLNLSDNLILAAIIGPVLIGVGSGFIMKGHATTGGTDIIAMITHKYLRVRFSNALIAIDGIIILLGLASLFIVYNTVSLTLFMRREEIIIMKLVGATNWFIRGPFLVEGFFQGIIASTIAILFLLLSYNFILTKLSELIPFFASDVGIGQLFKLSMKLFMMGVVLGISGSLLSLRDINKFRNSTAVYEGV